MLFLHRSQVSASSVSPVHLSYEMIWRRKTCREAVAVSRPLTTPGNKTGQYPDHLSPDMRWQPHITVQMAPDIVTLPLFLGHTTPCMLLGHKPDRLRIMNSNVHQNDNRKNGLLSNRNWLKATIWLNFCLEFLNVCNE